MSTAKYIVRKNGRTMTIPFLRPIKPLRRKKKIIALAIPAPPKPLRQRRTTIALPFLAPVKPRRHQRKILDLPFLAPAKPLRIRRTTLVPKNRSKRIGRSKPSKEQSHQSYLRKKVKEGVPYYKGKKIIVSKKSGKYVVSKKAASKHIKVRRSKGSGLKYKKRIMAPDIMPYL